MVGLGGAEGYLSNDDAQLELDSVVYYFVRGDVCWLHSV